MPAAPSTAADKLKRAVRVLPRDERIQVTPDALNRKVCDAPDAMIERIGVFDWVPAGDGTYRPVIRLHEQNIRLNIAARVLDVDYFALRRLITAGFVEGQATTPGAWHINLHSYFRHIEAVRTDPDFWNDENRARYSAAL